MTAAPGQPPRVSLRRAVVGVVLYCFFAPAALLALPLAALLLASRPRTRGDAFLAIVAGGFSLWWLWQPGDLADQVLRAAAVMGTAAFVLTALATQWSVTHRAVVAIGAAASAVAAWLAVVGRTWWELGWSVAHRAGFAARQSLSVVYGVMSRDGQPTPGAAQWLKQAGTMMDTTVQLMSAYYPATVALQMLAGFALATLLCRHLTTPAPGVPLGRLREFRFSEHLGWGAAIPLMILLIPKLAAAKVAAGNVLVVTVALYALRGTAVVAFALAMTGGGGLLLSVAIAFAIVFMSPVVLAGTVFLGVLDAGLDLRRRWTSPPAGE
ncbi:MAG TPA: DUF2232 domain-containing protein [Gemmatimonadales bacterium]